VSGSAGFALVTGASRGIGAAFAMALAAEGRNLLLTARSADDLAALRARLLRPGIAIHCLPEDLRSHGATRLLDEIERRGWEVDLLVNNAGLGSGGEFTNLDLEREHEILKVNVAALVELTHGCAPAMRARGRGAILNVASTASFQPVPYLATYAASKAFVLSFSLALREEMRRDGVHVMALCPGPTRTDFFRVAGVAPRPGPMPAPEEVVAEGLRGLRRRRAVVICGAGNRVMIAAERLLPRTLQARVVAAMMRSWRKAGE